MKSLFAALLLVPLTIWANDSAVGEANGTIVFRRMPEVSIDKEVLTISQKKIEVAYIFTNSSAKELTERIAFPMPPMYFGSSDHSDIRDFKIRVDGKEIKPVRKLVVLLDGHIDISAKVSSMGWTEKDLVNFLDRFANQNGVVPKGKKPFPEDWFNRMGEARFTLNEYFIWQQTFPAGRSVSIEHTYSPSVETGVPYDAGTLIENYGKQTCMDKSTRNTLHKYDGTQGVTWGFLRYVLTTANNWQGPIKDFTLRIEKDFPSDVISLCFDGKLTKKDSLTFEFRQKDFQPKNDLSIFYGGKIGDY